jgi:hypothetical protein
MSQLNRVICVTLLVGSAACVTAQDEEGGIDPALPEAAAKGSAPASVDSDDSRTSFFDACLLPGMTRAVFRPTTVYDADDEGVTAALDLPFPFQLYGATQARFWITTNGQLGFGNTPGGSIFGRVSCPLADSRLRTPILLAYSADLVGRAGPDAGVCFATTGLAPRRQLVVTWKDSFFYEAWLTSHVTFSATLNEGTNVIDVAIDRASAPDLTPYESGYGAALGKQSGGTGYAFSCYQSRAPAGTVVHYNP